MSHVFVHFGSPTNIQVYASRDLLRPTVATTYCTCKDVTITLRPADSTMQEVFDVTYRDPKTEEMKKETHTFFCLPVWDIAGHL